MLRNAHFSKALLSLVLLALVIPLISCGGAEDRKAKYFKRGVELYDEGNYTQARLEFKNVLQIDPKDVEGLFMFGQLEEKEQHWRKAYALFLRVVEINPKHTKAQLHLGRLYVMGGTPEKALESAKGILQDDPDNSMAMVLQGLAKAKMGEKDDAIQDIEAAIKADPENLDALSLLATLYADQQKFDQAIGLAKQGLKSHPKDVGTHLLLARFYEKTGDTEGIISLLKDLIKLQPDSIVARARLAAYYYGKDNKAEAEKVLRTAISAIPDSVQAKRALLELLVRTGKKDEAEKELKGFITQSPEQYELQFELAKLYLSTGRKDDARKVYQNIIEQDGYGLDGAKARTKLATVLILEEDVEQASALLEEVLREDPRNTEALLVRAAISMSNKEGDNGITDLRTILQEDPGHVKAHRLKARAHLAKGEIALARESLENAIQAQPQEVAANFELAKLLVQSGEVDAAVQVLEKLLKFFPDNLEVLQSISKIRIGQQKWSEVAPLALRIQEKYPTNPLGYYYQGLVQQGEKNYAESLRSFERSLERAPDGVEPLIALARSQVALDQIDKALARVEQVVTRNPEHFLALNLKGEIQMRQKHLDAATVTFNQVIELKPDWPVPYRNLARVSAAQNGPDAILDVLKRGYEKSKNSSLGLEVASIYDRNGETQKAIILYEKLLVDHPNMVMATNNLAMILVRGEPQQDALDRALELVEGFSDIENPLYLDTLGWVRYKRGEMDQAATLFEKAAHKGGEVPEIQYHLGMAYYKLGKMAGAKRALTRALEKDTAFAWREEAEQTLASIAN